MCIRIIVVELNKSIAIHFFDYTVYIDLHNSTRKKYDGVVVVYYSTVVLYLICMLSGIFIQYLVLEI